MDIMLVMKKKLMVVAVTNICRFVETRFTLVIRSISLRVSQTRFWR